MPIVIQNAEESEAVAHDASEMLEKNGQPTVEARVIDAFLSEVDWTELTEDDDVLEFSDVDTVKAQIDENGVVSGDDGEIVEAEDGEEVAVSETPGFVVAEMVDLDDLHSMFEHYVLNMPENTLEEKAEKAVMLPYLSEEALEEYDKGDFKKIHKKGKAGKTLVKRMMMAMMFKGSIKRAGTTGGYTSGSKWHKNVRKYGKGYKPDGGYKGTGYEKDQKGYDGGHNPYKSEWIKWKGGTTKDDKAAKLTASITKSKGKAPAKKTTLKATVKKGAAKSKAKEVVKATAANVKKFIKKPSKFTAPSKKKVAGDFEQHESLGIRVEGTKVITEGATLAGSILGKMAGKPLTESAK